MHIIPKVERTFSCICSVWETVSKAKAVLKQVMQSRIASCDIEGLLKQQQEVAGLYAQLTGDPSIQGPLSLVGQVLSELTPTLEITSMLASTAIKNRHWEEMQDKIFVPCQLSLR